MSKLPHKIRNSPSVALQADHALKIMDGSDRVTSAKGEEPRVPKGQAGGGQWTIESNPATNTLRITNPDGSVEERIGGSPAWRHNNPGNLRPFKDRTDAHDYGAIGATGPDKDRFLVFKNREDGEAATAQNLQHRADAGQTLEEAIKQYAPKKDRNDPVAYARNVAAAAGIEPGTKLNSAEGQKAMPKIIAAIHRQEGWVEGTIHRSTGGKPS